MATNEQRPSQKKKPAGSKQGDSQRRPAKKRRKVAGAKRPDDSQQNKDPRRKASPNGKKRRERSGDSAQSSKPRAEVQAAKRRPVEQQGKAGDLRPNTKRKKRRPEAGQPKAQKGAPKRRPRQDGQKSRAGGKQRRTSRPVATKRRAGSRNPAMRMARGLNTQQRTIVSVVSAALAIVVVALAVTFLLRTIRGRNQEFHGVMSAEDIATTTEATSNSTDINLLMVGDILFHYQVRQSGLQADGTRNYDHVFEHFKSELEDKDIKVVNQETPLGGKEIGGDAPDGFGSYPTFNGPQEMGDAEAEAGFNVVLKATNHTLDAGYEGLNSEMEFWQSEHPSIKTIGAVDPEDSSSTVEDIYVFEKDGFKVALLNYSFKVEEISDPDGVVSLLEEKHIRSTMEKARESADMIVVFPHWGIEYETKPCEEQYSWAQLFIDEGADVIIGNHPHVIQPVEMLESDEGKLVPCYWSTGNFISTSPDDMSLLGGVPELTLRKSKDGVCSVESAELKMVVTHIGEGEDMTVYPLTEWTDELAATNKLDTEMNPNTDNSTLTPEWAAKFCKEVLGSDYDEQTATFTLDLNAAPKKLSTSSSSSSSASDSSTDSNSQSLSGSEQTSADLSNDSSLDYGSQYDTSLTDSSSQTSSSSLD